MPYEDDYKMWLEKALIRMNPDWVCDGMYDVELTHEWCRKHCGEGSDYVTPKCLHMFYHHIVRADRKTENSSEKPNNCEECKHWNDTEDDCADRHGCRTTTEDCSMVETQTDYGDFADRLAYERGVKHAWEVAQKVFDSTLTFYEAEDLAKQIDKDINVRSKDEPQTCSFSDCDNFKNPDYERCIECKRKQIKLKTEQTERSE